LAKLKLYTNGCSYTQGTMPFSHDMVEQSYNGYKYFAEKQDFVWPWQLSAHFEFTFNHGRAATGVDRLLRTTLEFIEHLDPAEYSEWIFILEPSSELRKEYIFENGDIGQIKLPEKDSADTTIFFHTKHHDLDFLNAQNYNDDDLDPSSKALLEYHLLFQNSNSFRSSQLKNLLLLQSILNEKGIRYLFVPMQTLNADSNPEDCHTFLNYIIKYLDTDNIITSMTRQLNEQTDADHADLFLPDDSHPNWLGNKIITENILHEMEKRNWLT
jgi:hypothetical protein